MVSELMLRKDPWQAASTECFASLGRAPYSKDKLLISIEKIEPAPHIINQVSCSVQSIPYLNREELLYDNEPAI